jgi:hypothetical protein
MTKPIKSRDTIVDRIKALKARADDDASSEEEVKAATKRLAKMIAEHDIAEWELKGADQSSAVHATGVAFGKDRMEDLMRGCWDGMETFCEVKFYRDNTNKKLATPNFIGQAHDVEMALYLYGLFQISAKWGYHRVCGEAFDYGAPRPNRESFMLGFGSRVGEMMMEAAEMRLAQRKTAATGSELVIVKSALVQDKIAEMGLSLHTPRRARANIDHNAYNAGKAEGGGVSLERPLNDRSSHNTKLGA